ncbi:MAG TPA: helix-turn-helix domain-containing protein [Gemmatimonadales bacterium]|nr:helix-turn-helix domain-containing protein [Gemmatimonadales bacterium]
MKVSRQGDRRKNQKERTRAALVDAAASLLRQQVTPTVEEVAEAAKISRATAYRYFPTQESLLLEIATIAPLFEPVEEEIRNITDPEAPERLGILLDVMNRTIFANEAQVRTALRVYMDQWIDARRQGDSAPPPARVGRRMLYLGQVLAGPRAQLSATRWRRLQAALALTMGPEALVVMKDVCRLSEEEAVEVLRWAALALLDRGLKEAGRGTRAGRLVPRRHGSVKRANRIA